MSNHPDPCRCRLCALPLIRSMPLSHSLYHWWMVLGCSWGMELELKFTGCELVHLLDWQECTLAGKSPRNPLARCPWMITPNRIAWDHSRLPVCYQAPIESRFVKAGWNQLLRWRLSRTSCHHSWPTNCLAPSPASQPVFLPIVCQWGWVGRWPYAYFVLMTDQHWLGFDWWRGSEFGVRDRN